MAVADAQAIDVQELIAAYQTLDLELAASSSAIRMRYRELALLHHPDKHPHGSEAQAQAAARMALINAAYELIHDAPLRHHRPAVGSIEAEPRPDRGAAFDRPVSVATETLVRMVLGAIVGFGLAVLLERSGVPGFSLYVWVCPILLGFAFTSTSDSTLDALRVLLQLIRWRV